MLYVWFIIIVTYYVYIINILDSSAYNPKKISRINFFR